MKTEPIEIWHQRLGHANHSRIKMAFEKRVEQLNCSKENAFDNCVSFILGKMTRKSFSTKRAFKPGEVLHFDILQNALAGFRQEKCSAFFVTFSGGFPSLQPTGTVATGYGGHSYRLRNSKTIAIKVSPSVKFIEPDPNEQNSSTKNVVNLSNNSNEEQIQVESNNIANRTRNKVNSDQIEQQVHLNLTSTLVDEALHVPETFKEAMQSPESKYWKGAMGEKIDSAEWNLEIGRLIHLLQIDTEIEMGIQDQNRLTWKRGTVQSQTGGQRLLTKDRNLLHRNVLFCRKIRNNSICPCCRCTQKSCT